MKISRRNEIVFHERGHWLWCGMKVKRREFSEACGWENLSFDLVLIASRAMIASWVMIGSWVMILRF
jgi:hypothetical protein